MYAVTLCHDGCEIWRRHWTTNLRVAALVAFHNASQIWAKSSAVFVLRFLFRTCRCYYNGCIRDSSSGYYCTSCHPPPSHRLIPSPNHSKTSKSVKVRACFVSHSSPLGSSFSGSVTQKEERAGNFRSSKRRLQSYRDPHA